MLQLVIFLEKPVSGHLEIMQISYKHLISVVLDNVFISS